MLNLANAQADRPVIDVGDLEIDGEVRKPFMRVLESEQSRQNLLTEAAHRSIKQHEKKLLEFKKIESATEKKK
jgi:hypothetical protein